MFPALSCENAEVTAPGLSTDSIVFIYAAIIGVGVFVGTVVITTLKAKDYFDKKFADTRKLLYALTGANSAAIRRLEFWAVRRDSEAEVDDPFQPGADPMEFVSVDNGKDH